MKIKLENKKRIYTSIIIIISIVLILCIVFGIQNHKRKQISHIETEVSEYGENNVTNELIFELSSENIVGEEVPENEIENEINDEEKNETQEENIVENNESQNDEQEGKPYLIRVNTEAQCITIYKMDANGNFTIPIKAMICSTGVYTPPVSKYPETTYKITGKKYRWAYLQQNVCGQYATQIVGNILFHSVPYTSYGNPGSLEYWEYDKLGTNASLGCIRLQVEDAKWIYYNAGTDTVVEFYKDSNPGPLGKPTISKISDNVRCRNYDPTDEASNNPWKEQ